MFIVQSHEVARDAVDRLPFVSKDASDAEKYVLAQKVIGSTSAQCLGERSENRDERHQTPW